MAQNIMGKAGEVGQRIGAAVEKAGTWVKDHVVGHPAPNLEDITVHMPVIASCGKRVGIVDSVEGGSIKLTRSAPAAHAEHRYIPLSWVESVDECVRLNKNGDETESEWGAAPIATSA